MAKFIDETNNRYGNLTVLERAPNLTKAGSVCWYCQCTCGRIVTKSGSYLRNRSPINCNCCYSNDGPLTLEYLRKILDYDPQTGYFIWKVHKGNAAKPGNIAGTTKVNGYIDIVINRKHYLGHRLAWFWMHGNWPPEHIDHINRNKADNRLCNLRLATQSENAKNANKRSDNSSGYPGVNWMTHRKKWRAYITTGGNTIHLGSFSKKEDAIKVRKEAEKKHGFFTPP